MFIKGLLIAGATGLISTAAVAQDDQVHSPDTSAQSPTTVNPAPTPMKSAPMPPSASFASCSAPGVALAVLKRAEMGDALVLRAHETWGRAAETRIELPRWGIGFDASFGPSELKTFRIEADGRVTETDLLEGLEAEPS